MSIPLWFKTSEYCRVDTVDFDYKDSVGEDDQITDNFKKGNIYFDFDNGLPFEMDLQVYLANKDYIKIDSRITSYNVCYTKLLRCRYYKLSIDFRFK